MLKLSVELAIQYLTSRIQWLISTGILAFLVGASKLLYALPAVFAMQSIKSLLVISGMHFVLFDLQDITQDREAL